MAAQTRSILEISHALDEIEECCAHRAVLERAPRFHQRMEFLGAELRRQRLKLGIAVGGIDELQERDLQVASETDKAVDRDAVFPLFIFLNLLESHVEKLGDLALALARSAAGSAEIVPQIAVERPFGQAFFVISGHGQNLWSVVR